MSLRRGDLIQFGERVNRSATIPCRSKTTVKTMKRKRSNTRKRKRSNAVKRKRPNTVKRKRPQTMKPNRFSSTSQSRGGLGKRLQPATTSFQRADDMAAWRPEKAVAVSELHHGWRHFPTSSLPRARRMRIERRSSQSLSPCSGISALPRELQAI